MRILLPLVILLSLAAPASALAQAKTELDQAIDRAIGLEDKAAAIDLLAAALAKGCRGR